MKRKLFITIFGLVSVLDFICAVIAFIVTCGSFSWLWASLFFIAILGTVSSWQLVNELHSVQKLDDACRFKDGLINNLHEQINKLYDNMERVAIAAYNSSSDDIRKEDNQTESETVPSSEQQAEPVKDAVNSGTVVLDVGEITISAMSDKVCPVISKNLYIQPNDVLNRWWRVRGYDTALQEPSKAYYIYIRLSHKGCDGEVRFISKPHLSKNDTHRFIQVGTISPLIDGTRTVSFSLDGFRFKLMKRERTND